MLEVLLTTGIQLRLFSARWRQEKLALEVNYMLFPKSKVVKTTKGVKTLSICIFIYIYIYIYIYTVYIQCVKIECHEPNITKIRTVIFSV